MTFIIDIALTHNEFVVSHFLICRHLVQFVKSVPPHFFSAYSIVIVVHTAITIAALETEEAPPLFPARIFPSPPTSELVTRFYNLGDMRRFVIYYKLLLRKHIGHQRRKLIQGFPRFAYATI